MPVLRNIGRLVTGASDGVRNDGAGVPAALAWTDGRITYAGPESALPPGSDADGAIDAQGALVIPGLVDCHTHLAFAGWRADEFAARLAGRTYHEIAAAGGGIMSTVRATRAASEDALFARAASFADAMVALGVTTIECKSGYGLTVDDELKLLRVYRRLAERGPMRIVPTFLGAHTIPAERRSDRARYVAEVIDEMIPRAAADRLAVCCDIFIDDAAFTIDEARRILTAARDAGLAVKVHADQLTAGGGAELAAELGAWSADHLECVSDAGIAALARAGVVAVSLPLATLYLGQRPMPARRLIDAGVAVAVATDFNPGTAPTWHLPLAMMLACTLQRMTPDEVLRGATSHAARAVGLGGEIGTLEPGKRADFVLVDAPSVEQWMYNFRENAAMVTVIGGVTVSREPRAACPE